MPLQDTARRGSRQLKCEICFPTICLESSPMEKSPLGRSPGRPRGFPALAACFGALATGGTRVRRCRLPGQLAKHLHCPSRAQARLRGHPRHPLTALPVAEQHGLCGQRRLHGAPAMCTVGRQKPQQAVSWGFTELYKFLRNHTGKGLLININLATMQISHCS